MLVPLATAIASFVSGKEGGGGRHVGGPWCRHGATLLQETRVATAPHIYIHDGRACTYLARRQLKPGFEPPTACL